MGKGTVAKKRKSKTDNPDRDILKEELSNTGPYILRDFCRQYSIDPDDVKTFPKTKLINFLMGQFDDGALAFNNLYPDKKGKKSENEESDDDDLDLDNLDGDDLDLEFDEEDVEGDEGDEGDEGEKGRDAPDISVLEDKVDKLMDLNSKVSKRLDLVSQLLLELMETLRQGLKVQFKLGKIKNPAKLLKQIEKKARESVSTSSNDDDDELEDE